MPIELQTTVPTPNALMVPTIILSTNPSGTGLVTSASIVMMAAHVDANGSWTPTGASKTVVIDDVEHLEEDIASLSPTVLSVMGGILSLIAGLNDIRKVL
jgi:hypothetical protein